VVRPTIDKNSEEYQRHKERMGHRSREITQSAREIGPLPAVVDPARRASCENSLKLFLETYLPETFNLPWSNDHLRAIEVMQDVILNGGQYALAMPRRQGKTTLITGATLWAILYGHRKFVVVIAATKQDSVKIANNVKITIETDERLAGDFPEACYPVGRLEGINNRAAGQTLDGELTRIRWTREEIVFPNLPGQPCSSARLYCRSITGAIRGLSDKLPDGTTIRPELVLLDDPQTERSAKSAHSTGERERTVSRAVLGLGGANKRLASFAAVTVIQQDDLAARLLDRQRNPDWRGDLMKLVYEMPTDMEFWKTYRDKRNELIRFERPLSELNQFYLDHREQADAGCVVAWEHRYEPDQVSAIQYAMDLWAKDEDAFLSEYQNSPRRQELEGAFALTTAEVQAKVCGIPRGYVPDWAEKLTAFVDVQQDALFFLVAAWDAELRGHVVDYGSWPEQGRAYYTKADIRKTLLDHYRAATVEHALHAGLVDLLELLLGKQWQTQSRGESQLDLVFVDANWVVSTDVVYQVARTVGNGRVMPWHGRYVSATSQAIEAGQKQPGDKTGPGWRTTLGKKNQRQILADVNQWKTTVSQRLRTINQETGITLFGDRPDTHVMLSDHLTAEFALDASSESTGRKIYEWKQRIGRDNEWFDGLVGAAVAANYLGASMPGQQAKPERKRVSWREQQQAKRELR
jgi:hypothetical protein